MRSEAPIRYSIVIPFYNEQESIPTLYMKITEVMDSIGAVSYTHLTLPTILLV